MWRIATICSGNICRSPMAAKLLEHKLELRQRPALVISAGTLNLSGHPAALHARQAMAQVGLSLEAHRSQGIRSKLITYADDVLIMAPHHGQEVLALYPELEPKLVALWQHAPEQTPGWPLSQIEDPVNRGLSDFVRCRELLSACLDRWLDARQAAARPQA